MTAPTGTARATPGGTPLRDGHPTKITFAADTDVEFWEKSVQPPGLEGGDPVDATTMHNTTYRVQRPRTLKTLTEVNATVAYDPLLYDTSIVALINQETTITITYSNGDHVAFFGFLQSFIPTEHTEGDQPEADIVIVPTNWDTSGSGAEEGPAYGTAF